MSRVDMGGNRVPDDWRECWSCGGIGVVPARELSARFKCGPCCGLGFIPPEQAGPSTAEETASVHAWLESIRAEVKS